MNWVDIGVNLTNQRYDKDRVQVIEQALGAGVSKMIITGTNALQSEQALKLANTMPNILYATAGCHPHDAKSFCEQDLLQLNQLAQAKQVVAVGECGLDFNRNFSPKEDQIKVFIQQLELAVKIQKPVFLHERDAFDTQYQILKDYIPQLSGTVAHCFTGSQNELESYLDLGLHIGITGWICDERRGQMLYNITKLIPNNRIMLETDGPYLTPRTLKGKQKKGRNEPKYLPHIAKTVAQALNQNLQQVADNSYLNSCRFFNLN